MNSSFITSRPCRIEADIHPQDVAVAFYTGSSPIVGLASRCQVIQVKSDNGKLIYSSFIVAPLFDFAIVIVERGLFLTDQDLDDRKLQPSMKTDCSKATICGWPQSGENV